MLYSISKDYMFGPVVAIIRSLSFDTLKSIIKHATTQLYKYS